MSKWKRFLLLGSLAMVLLTGLMFTSHTLVPRTSFANSCSPATGNWSGNCQISEGNISDYVYAIQESINDTHLCAQIAEDGDFGSATFAAVECYQTAKHLGIDGIVGMQTWTSLHSTLVFVSNDGTFSFYRGSHSNLNFDFAKGDSTGVWWVWVRSDSEWCTMDLNSPC